MAKVPAFTDIGKATRDLLGQGKDATFVFDKVVSLTSKTADGVEFTLNNVVKDTRVEQLVKAAYRTPNYAVTASVNPAGKIVTSVQLTEPVPNLTAIVSGTLPDQASGKLALDYTLPSLTLKSTIGLTANPKVDIAATTGYKGAVFGGSTSYDSATGNITTWSLGAGYTGLDYQVGAILTDNDSLKASYTHNVDHVTSVGAEVTRMLNKESTAFRLGYAKRFESGALGKIRLENSGVTSLLYQVDIKPKTTLTHSLQFDATNVNLPPKFGLALDIKA
jgi:voltage-dependent anion channel protein 2